MGLSGLVRKGHGGRSDRGSSAEYASMKKRNKGRENEQWGREREGKASGRRGRDGGQRRDKERKGKKGTETG